MDLVRCVVPSSCGVRGRIVSAIILDRLNAVSIRAALLAALAVCLFPMGTAAQAEPFEPQYRAWEGYDYAPFSPPDRAMGDSEPLSQKRQRAHTKHESKAESQPRRAHTIDESRPKAESQRQRAPKGKESEPKAKFLEVAKGPIQIIISIADQRISVYDDGTLIARSSVSTGVQGHPTPVGVFSIIGKELWHRSNIYSAAPMPYMQRITWSGIALHAGVLPGHPASHGCIRLANDFAIRLWRLTKCGTRVNCAPRCPPGPNSEPASFFKIENRVQFTRAFGRRLRRERRPHTRDKSYPVSAKYSVARRHKPFTCHRSRSAEKGRPDLSFCEPQIEQAFCTSGLYVTV